MLVLHCVSIWLLVNVRVIHKQVQETETTQTVKVG